MITYKYASILLFIFCLIQLLHSCKKTDFSNNVNRPSRDFFDLPANASSPIKRTVAEFERQNKITGFVKELVAQNGMPLWEKSVINISKRKNVPMANFDGDGSFEIEDTLVFTPLVEQDSLFVNGFFLSKLTSDSVELHLFRGNDYDNYSYGSLRDSNSLTAERVSLELMKLNYQVFGYKEFIITDSLLFTDDTNMDSNLVYRSARLKTDQQSGFAGNNTNNFLVSVIELCNWGNCPPAERNGSLSRNITPGGGGTPSCRTCWTVTILNDFPDGNPNPTAPSQGGGMGSPPANGNCTGNANCRESSRILEGRFPCGDCGPGPIIVVPPDDPPVIIDTILNPCADAILLQSDASFQSYMNELKDSCNSNREYGYFLFRDPANNLFASTPHGLIQGPANELNLGDLTNQYILDCIAHSHFNTNTDSTRGLSIFSPDDLWTLCDQFNFGNIGNNSTFTFALVTKNGTQYLLKIENLTKFRSWAREMTLGNFNIFKASYSIAYRIKPTNTTEVNEKKFLQFLKLNNGSGLKLFRGNSTFTQWQPIGLNASNEVVNAPCQ